ncbi:hypothetical protein GCM10027075_33910 [Streptomyces heilongjiangensis]
MSPTVGTAMAAPTVITVRITMETGGAGTTVVTFGKNTVSARAKTRPARTSARRTFGAEVQSGFWPRRRAAGDTARRTADALSTGCRRVIGGRARTVRAAHRPGFPGWGHRRMVF